MGEAADQRGRAAERLPGGRDDPPARRRGRLAVRQRDGQPGEVGGERAQRVVERRAVELVGDQPAAALGGAGDEARRVAGGRAVQPRRGGDQRGAVRLAGLHGGLRDRERERRLAAGGRADEHDVAGRERGGQDRVEPAGQPQAGRLGGDPDRVRGDRPGRGRRGGGRRGRRRLRRGRRGLRLAAAWARRRSAARSVCQSSTGGGGLAGAAAGGGGGGARRGGRDGRRLRHRRGGRGRLRRGLDRCARRRDLLRRRPGRRGLAPRPARPRRLARAPRPARPRSTGPRPGRRPRTRTPRRARPPAPRAPARRPSGSGSGSGAAAAASAAASASPSRIAPSSPSGLSCPARSFSDTWIGSVRSSRISRPWSRQRAVRLDQLEVDQERRVALALRLERAVVVPARAAEVRDRAAEVHPRRPEVRRVRREEAQRHRRAVVDRVGHVPLAQQPPQPLRLRGHDLVAAARRRPRARSACPCRSARPSRGPR